MTGFAGRYLFRWDEAGNFLDAKTCAAFILASRDADRWDCPGHIFCGRNCRDVHAMAMLAASCLPGGRCVGSVLG